MHANNVSPDDEGDASGVLSTILGSSPFAPSVREIEQILGIDHGFPAALNLVEKLRATLQTIPNKSDSVQEWIQALESVQEAGVLREQDVLWTRAAATSRSGNPLGNNLTRYPLPAFLLQKPLPGVNEQANLIHRLFLEVLLKQKSSSGFQTVAIELRKLIASSGPKSSIGELPTDVSADWSVWGPFVEGLPENDDLAKLLHKLLASVMLAKSAKTGQAAPVLDPTPPESQPFFSTFGAAIGGDLPSYRTKIREAGDIQTGEPPTYIDLHVALPEEDASEQASEQEVDASSRETRHWISHLQRLTPNYSGRFTPGERRQVASRLCEFIVCEDKELSLGAGLVALMYVTGMNLESLLQASLGPEGVFNAYGEYRRVIRSPRKAYTPNSDVEDQFLPQESTLVLQMPDVVTRWIRSIAPPRTCTLMESTGVELSKIKDCVDDVMKRLRAGSRYPRIRRERIPAALAIELSLKYRDLALIHHLASGPDQDSPMISYYVVHFIEELKLRYRRITEEMLSAR